MSVILETSLGDITIDLFVQEAPKSCENFLKLCKIKYYNYAPIHTVQRDFTLQTGDPIGPGSPDSDGGSSIWGILDGSSSTARKTFTPEFPPKLKHTERGTVSMATAPSARDPDVREAASQFIITLGDSTPHLDGRAAPFGRVVEGFDTLEAINTAFVDPAGRPLQDIRIRHTIILDEASIPDPPGLSEPASSPVPSKAQLATVRIADDETLDPNADEAAVARVRRERDARAQALTLEMVGDLPFAEVAPPENVLFVCKLNPVTRDADLELIFSRFGLVRSCEVVRDRKSGDSLQYAFVEFADKEAAEMAYFKMQSVLIDDCRIHVDFSQSVSKLADVWRDGAERKRGGGRGGWGGIEGLEKKRQYRAYEDRDRDRDRRGKYGMVFDGKKERRGDERRDDDRRRDNEDRRDDESQRDHSRDARPAGTRRHRSRSRSPQRHEHDSTTSRDPHRHRERSSSRDGHRHREERRRR